jgi:hypothetical protein
MKYADVVGDSLGFYFVNERTRLLFQTQFPSEVDCSFQQRIKARNYFCLNPKIVCDCVDLLKSDIFSRHSDDDMDFGLHVRFRRDYVPDCYLFKAQQDASKIFATEKFVGFAREHRLTGIFFEDAEKMMGLRGAHNAVHGFPMA